MHLTSFVPGKVAAPETGCFSGKGGGVLIRIITLQ